MSDEIVRRQVTESISVAASQSTIHISLANHLDGIGGGVFLTGALLLSPDVARSLAAALTAAVAEVPDGFDTERQAIEDEYDEARNDEGLTPGGWAKSPT